MPDWASTMASPKNNKIYTVVPKITNLYILGKLKLRFGSFVPSGQEIE